MWDFIFSPLLFWSQENFRKPNIDIKILLCDKDIKSVEEEDDEFRKQGQLEGWRCQNYNKSF